MSQLPVLDREDLGPSGLPAITGPFQDHADQAIPVLVPGPEDAQADRIIDHTVEHPSTHNGNNPLSSQFNPTDHSVPGNPWNLVKRKHIEAAKAREREKAERRQQLLDYLHSEDGKGIDVMSLCAEFNIPVYADGDHGDKYERTEAELRTDLEKYLDKEREKAWRATNQAVRAMADPVSRTLNKAQGITTASNSITLTNEDLMPIQEGWGPSLCGMFAGRFPGKEAVHIMIQRWNVPVKPAFHRKGWIVFSFKYQKDAEKVLNMGPQAIFGIPLILEPTPDDFDFNKKLKVTVPMWIRIPDLPMTLWSKTTIEKIATTDGTPVMVDEDTILKYTLDGPRVQVIVNILEEPREKVEIVLPNGDKFDQSITFELRPKYCHTCQIFGHISEGCPGPEAREKERIMRARQSRNKSRGPETRNGRGPSRGPVPKNGRSLSRGRQGAPKQNVPPVGNTSYEWQPTGKLKGKKGTKGKEQGRTPVVTANQFAALENAEGSEATKDGAGPSHDRNTVLDKHGNRVSYPVVITGAAAAQTKAPPKESTAKNVEAGKVTTNQPPETMAPRIVDGDGTTLEDGESEAGSDQEPEFEPSEDFVKECATILGGKVDEFPSTQEALADSSGRKGRNPERNTGPSAKVATAGKPPIPGNPEGKKHPKDPSRSRSRGRSKDRDYAKIFVFAGE